VKPLPKIAIVIVNYKGKADTLECLQSLAELTYPHFEIIVVDQASGDGTLEEIAVSFPAVLTIANPENNGFAGGNNIGVKAALERGAEYTFLLNNDTTVEPGLLEKLLAVAEREAKIGIVGPMMLYHAEPHTVWSAGATVNWRGDSVLVGEGKPDDDVTVNGAAREVDFIVGCAQLIKRAVWEQVGLFDESYFLYYEESDFCRRVHKAGWSIVYEPGARMWHKVSRSTGAGSPLTLYYMRRNALRFVARHSEKPLAGQVALLTDAVRLSLVWTVRGQADKRRVLLRAVTDALRGRFGKARFSFT